MAKSHHSAPSATVMLTGDVMTGRGVDQVLGHPSKPLLHEPYIQDARDYVRMAETVNGQVPAPVPSDYIWGDLLPEIDRHHPDVRIVNLEFPIFPHRRRWTWVNSWNPRRCCGRATSGSGMRRWTRTRCARSCGT